jgi:hypothetical protein
MRGLPVPDGESARAIRHRAELLATLPKVEAFAALTQECERKERRMTEALMQRLLSGESLDVLQRQIDYDRGWIDAMRYITHAIPAGAERMLERQTQSLNESEPEEDFWSVPTT